MQQLETKDEQLEFIALELHGLIDIAQRSWYEIGLKLSQARELIPGDREFGQWCTAQGFALSRHTLLRYRECTEFAGSHANQQMPSDWSVVYSLSTMDEHTQQRALEWVGEHDGKVSRAQFNKKFPKTPRPDRGQAAVKKTTEAADEAKEGLSVTAKEKLERARKAELKRLQAGFTAAVGSEVSKIVESEKEKLESLSSEYESRIQAARDEEYRYAQLTNEFSTLLTMDEYKMVRGCLHPDRATSDKERDRLNKAFALFSKMEHAVNKKMPIAELRRRGWEKVSPYHKK